MVEAHVLVGGIPAIFWGSPRPRRLLAVHGFGGSKGDKTIRLLTRRAVPLGWQVVSCDLPGHGSRNHALCAYEPKQCVEDLRQIFAGIHLGQTALFAQGTGAQWALLALQNAPLSQALLLSPTVGPGLPLKDWSVPTAILAPAGALCSPFGRAEDFAEKYHCSFTPAPRPDCLEPWLDRVLALPPA